MLSSTEAQRHIEAKNSNDSRCGENNIPDIQSVSVQLCGCRITPILLPAISQNLGHANANIQEPQHTNLKEGEIDA